jgi:hypothetical protein
MLKINKQEPTLIIEVKAGVIFSAAGSGEFFEETVSPSN